MEKKYLTQTNNLIALCNIIDDFKNFEEKLRLVISKKNNRDFVYQLYDISKGKFYIGAGKATRFYNENKEVIDIINKYSDITRFINNNYDFQGNSSDSLKFFYEYISSHKEEMDTILAVLGKLKELGFDEFEFNSSLDFTQETHKVCTSIYDNFDITYLNNLTAIPSYNPGVISYKTNNSDYKITVKVLLGDIRVYSKKIVLNNLIFDPNGLPTVISKEEIFDKIIGLKSEKEHEYSVVKDSVNLGVAIADLHSMFNQVSSKINNLENVEKKTELIELLSTVEVTILQMQAISDEYNKQIADTNSSMSEEFLDDQKKAYIKRREDSEIHWCW